MAQNASRDDIDELRLQMAQAIFGGLPDSEPISHWTQALAPLADGFGPRDRQDEEQEAADAANAERVWRDAMPVINPPPPPALMPNVEPPVPTVPRPTSPLVAAPMMSQAAARDLYDAVGVPPLSAGETALDVTKSTGIGLVKVPIQFLGMPGDVRSFASAATDWAAGKLGAAPETIDRIKRSGRLAFGVNPMFAPFVNGPTSAEIQAASNP